MHLIEASRSLLEKPDNLILILCLGNKGTANNFS